jgi:hypothetical protein
MLKVRRLKNGNRGIVASGIRLRVDCAGALEVISRSSPNGTCSLYTN